MIMWAYSSYVFHLFMQFPSPMFMTSMSDRIGYFFLATFLTSAGDPEFFIWFSSSSKFFEEWRVYWFPIAVFVYAGLWIVWNIIQYSLWQLIPNTKKEMSSGDTWVWYTVLLPIIGFFSYLYIGGKYRVSWKVFLKWSVKLMFVRVILWFVGIYGSFYITEFLNNERWENDVYGFMFIVLPLCWVCYLYWRGRKEQK